MLFYPLKMTLENDHKTQRKEEKVGFLLCVIWSVSIFARMTTVQVFKVKLVVNTSKTNFIFAKVQE